MSSPLFHEGLKEGEKLKGRVSSADAIGRLGVMYYRVYNWHEGKLY